jgi:hypothetical protein
MNHKLILHPTYITNYYELVIRLTKYDIGITYSKQQLTKLLSLFREGNVSGMATSAGGEVAPKRGRQLGRCDFYQAKK